MSRYIDADKIEYHEDDAVYRHEINAMPTADVRENVRGKWEHAVIWKDSYFKTVLPDHYCSVCKTWECGTAESNFCPNCGADMRGEKDDN